MHAPWNVSRNVPVVLAAKSTARIVNGASRSPVRLPRPAVVSRA